ncbi:hypothetical protein STRAU_7431 [Streptomyces aurantiacus JA 4570]|uniref:Uncharacterized protein n=1 Tax=Streptomyces aurantiacus JA 4570 TaxID=1286094 RepID=S3ZME1_9ACTN|nr:hypothetical protein STRAU_7431 [Streptomyces aurantiacus JA 4570]
MAGLRGCALIEHARAPSSLPVEVAGSRGGPHRKREPPSRQSPPRHVQRPTLRAGSSRP